MAYRAPSPGSKEAALQHLERLGRAPTKADFKKASSGKVHPSTVARWWSKRAQGASSPGPSQAQDLAPARVARGPEILQVVVEEVPLDAMPDLVGLQDPAAAAAGAPVPGAPAVPGAPGPPAPLVHFDIAPLVEIACQIFDQRVLGLDELDPDAPPEPPQPVSKEEKALTATALQPFADRYLVPLVGTHGDAIAAAIALYAIFGTRVVQANRYREWRKKQQRAPPPDVLDGADDQEPYGGQLVTRAPPIREHEPEGTTGDAARLKAALLDS